MTKKPDNLHILNNEIVKESQHWIRCNKGLSIAKEQSYGSPRISSEIPDCSMPMTFDHLSYCGMGCLYCTPAGTLISTCQGQTPIEDLKRGDLIYSYNTDSNKVEKDEVISFMSHKAKEIIIIELVDNKKLRLTPNHSVYTKNRGWIKAGELSETDELLISKRPATAFNMSKHNPMQDLKTAKKMSKSLKKGYASGKLDLLKRKLSKSGRQSIIACNKSEEQRARVRERMIKHNPMCNAKVAAKMGETRKRLFREGLLIPPALGNPRPDVSIRMLSEENPMKDKEIAKRALAKGRQTLLQKGNISEGQLRLRKLLVKLNMNFVEEMPIDGPKRIYLLDFYLPDLNLCLEYDGHSQHYSSKGKKRDKCRDKYLKRYHGLETLRIHRDLPFRQSARKELCQLLGDQ